MKKPSFIPHMSLVITCVLLFSACAPRYCKEQVEMNKTLETFGKNSAKTHGMKFLFVGDATDSQGVRYCIALQCSKPTQLDEGRQFAMNFFNEFYTMLTHDQSVTIFNQSCRQDDPHFPETIAIEKMGFRIGYWDENTERYKPPYLAQILFADKTFHYYEADPKTQELRLIFKESLDDAQKIQNEN
jgi:hypothetical protein